MFVDICLKYHGIAGLVPGLGYGLDSRRVGVPFQGLELISYRLVLVLRLINNTFMHPFFNVFKGHLCNCTSL